MKFWHTLDGVCSVRSKTHTSKEMKPFLLIMMKMKSRYI